MHELSILEALILELEGAARREGFRRVVAVRLEVGRLAGIDGEALRFAFETATRDTLVAGASLDLLEVPGRGRCRRCGREVPLADRFDSCPACGSAGVLPTGGLELRLKDIVVEEA